MAEAVEIHQMSVKHRKLAESDLAGAAVFLGAAAFRTKEEPHSGGDMLRTSLIVLAMFVTSAGDGLARGISIG